MYMKSDTSVCYVRYMKQDKITLIKGFRSLPDSTKDKS